MVPDGVQLVLDISAPRPVMTPFTLRFVIDAEGARFDACSADTERARRPASCAAATAAGLTRTAACTIGLGMPTPRWADAVGRASRRWPNWASASLTFSDADVTLLAGGERDAGRLSTGWWASCEPGCRTCFR